MRSERGRKEERENINLTSFDDIIRSVEKCAGRELTGRTIGRSVGPSINMPVHLCSNKNKLNPK